MNTQSLLLEAPDLCALVERLGKERYMGELIDRLTTFIENLDPALVQVPPRSGVQYSVPEWGLIETMPAHAAMDGTTVKLVGYHPSNPKRFGKPSVVSTIAVFDPNTGGLKGLLDGTFLTAMRTGAASAVASRVLAHPESTCIGVVGCGAQSITQVHALSNCFPIERVIGYDIDDTTMQNFAKRLSFLDLTVETVNRDELDKLVAASDILCTCTSSIPGDGPVIEDCEHKPHLHINAVGSDFHDKFEIPKSLLSRSLVCPDFLEQAVVEGECQQLEASQIGPDLREIVQRADQFRDARNKLTVFDSTGWALEDHVAGAMALDYAEKMGLGRPTTLECLPPDPKDPYSLLQLLSAPARSAESASTRVSR